MTAAELKSQIAPRVFYRHELPSMREPKRRAGWVNGGLCAFHDDRRPNSFHVNLDTGAFTCFACGASGGDLIAFTMRFHGLSFREALQRLAADWGVA